MSNQIIQLRHGTECDCCLLAAATHCHPEAIPLAYCRSVLQKRYVMNCRHGESLEALDPALRKGGWADLGSVDAVQAILVANV